MAAKYTPASSTSSTILAMDSVPSATSNRSDSQDDSYAKDQGLLERMDCQLPFMGKNYWGAMHIF